MNTASGSEASDPLQEARAYNRSIYLMVSMPYLLLGTVGFMIYRECKKRVVHTELTTSGELDQAPGEPHA